MICPVHVHGVSLACVADAARAPETRDEPRFLRLDFTAPREVAKRSANCPALARAKTCACPAIVAATFCYCLGTVLARPLLAAFTPLQVTAAQAVVGAIGLVGLSVALEPLSIATLNALATPGPLAGLIFLVVFGTVAAYTIYLRLVRDWGAPRAGLYAFVSPIVALALGALLFAEPIGWREAVGAAIMLGAAALAMARPATTR
jgi:drug/metabolite transporter (DMT)-like permease